MRSHRWKIVVCLFLIVATLAVYWQVQHHEFVNYDDDLYVTENHHVRAGLTGKGVAWAVTATHAGNWHPLTWLSHMLDYELFGLNACGHHMTNVFFHIVNALLLFLVLKRMTGALWQSAFVAALFALHPLHVESVAWVSERKDVLSTLFWILTIWAYVSYVEYRGIVRYFLVCILFAIGLMAKPMLVSLPFVLLLCDYWPLGRFLPLPFGSDTAPKAMTSRTGSRRSVALRLVCEKLPLVALAVASGVVTFVAQQKGGAVSPLEAYPLEIRIANALVSYVSYIGKTVWPAELAVFYPYPEVVSIWKATGAGLLLVSISVVVIRAARRFRYLAVGWMWYLVTLVPVIGLVQVGAQSMADRYSYITAVGLFIIISWGVCGIAERWRYGKIALGISSGVLLSALTLCAWLQVAHWKNSALLFEHAITVTASNPVAHNNLALALEEHGQLDEAIAHYLEAVQIKPDFAEAYNNLGSALDGQGRLDEATAYYSKALQLWPDFAEAHNNLASLLEAQGQTDDALAHYLKALRIKPDFVEAHNNVGVALAAQGKLDQAAAHYFEALELRPYFAEGHNNLGIVFAVKGNLEKAVMHYLEAVRLKPDYAAAHNNLGLAYWLLGYRDSALKEYRILKELDANLAEELLDRIRE